MQRLSLCLLMLLSVLPRLRIQAEPTIITGNGALSYSTMQLVFYRTSDWISGTEEIAGQCQVSETGDFHLTVSLENTTRMFTYLGIYKGYFFAEPGKSYQLVLPERADKSPEDRLNPYFEPVELQLGIANFNREELNMLIVMFDDAYIPFYDKYVNSIYSKPDIKRLEEDIIQMESPFKENLNSYFREYRQYRYGMLKMLANQQGAQSLSDEFFNNRPVLYGNPAYAELFNQVFDKYFVFFGRTSAGQQIYKDINMNGSYHGLLLTLSQSSNITDDTLKELIILKQLHDEFYSNQFSRNGLLSILDSVSICTKVKEHKLIAGKIKYKITRLQPGYEPPQFELGDTDGNLVKLSDYKGKYVYLNFCTCQSYSCLNEFNMLSALNKRHSNRLSIITIATDPLEDVLRQFLTKNKYDWKFLLYDNQPDILKEYDIRAFPTYFLIGPDGRLIYSPALSPAENFESKLFEVMRSRGDL